MCKPRVLYPRWSMFNVATQQSSHVQRIGMNQVKFGVGLFPIEPIHRMLTLIKLSEDVGFSCAYIGDSQMIWREPYVLLGAAAMTTKRIILASGVTNPVTRDLGVLAAAWASLHEMVGDRLLLGIGSGDSS